MLIATATICCGRVDAKSRLADGRDLLDTKTGWVNSTSYFSRDMDEQQNLAEN